jgi:hypothetical protein
MSSLEDFAKELESIVCQSGLRESIAAFERGKSFIDSNREEFLKRYPDCWIAVYEQQIIATDKNLKNLIDTIRKRGIRTQDVAVDLMTTKKQPVLL